MNRFYVVCSRLCRIALAGAFGVLSTVFALPAGPAHAAASVKIKAKYVVNLSGLKVGELRFVGEIGRDSYDVTGTGKLTGLPQLFTTFTGESVSRGTISDGSVHPAFHTIAYNTVKKDYSTRIEYASGNVARLELDPPYKEKQSRVPIEKKHKVDVIDPLSATILPGPAKGPLIGPESCDRTLRIFDGRERFDVTLTSVGLGKVEAQEKGGYAGAVIVCRVDYKPIAGHRRDDPLVEKWSKTGAIEVWFAPLLEANALVLYRVQVPTPLGSAVIYPKAFLVSTGGPEG
ncbi:MAG: DUF3108 domain-containing protein [Rhodobiaceae bacterium]|nr:DUF3108 domain-containing protein [Rhodobiaceae bacterium]